MQKWQALTLGMTSWWYTVDTVLSKFLFLNFQNIQVSACQEKWQLDVAIRICTYVFYTKLCLRKLVRIKPSGVFMTEIDSLQNNLTNKKSRSGLAGNQFLFVIAFIGTELSFDFARTRKASFFRFPHHLSSNTPWILLNSRKLRRIVLGKDILFLQVAEILKFPAHLVNRVDFVY